MPRAAHVLIVDDELPIRRIVTRWLRAWGYDVTSAESAIEALGVMAANPAEIMLCDVTMPEHDGFWLAERVRAQWPQTAIVMATALDDVQTVRKSRRLGAVDYVTKPFNNTLLRQALDRAFGTAQFRPSARRDS